MSKYDKNKNIIKLDEKKVIGESQQEKQVK